MTRVFKALMIWLLLTPAVGWGQTTFNGGLFLGLTSNQIDGDGLGGYNHTGAQLGFFANRDFNETWSARIELQYIWRGSRETVSDTSNFYRTDLHQISVPLIAEYHFTPKISVEAGPSLDINVITTEENIYGDLGPEPPYRPFVLNSILGVNYAITESTIVNFRSHYSLSSVRDVRLIQRPPGVFGDWINGSHTVSLSLAVYFYF